MKNQLEIMIEKLSDIEKSGIYIEDLQAHDRYRLMDENPMTLTGLIRPSGEYYFVNLSVLVRVDESFDETEIMKTQLQNYPEVQETFTVCKKKNNDVNAPLKVGTFIFKDPAHNKATKSEYIEDYIPKKSLKKVVKKAKP